MYSQDLLKELEAFYKEVDDSTSNIYALYKSKLKCRKGCSSCCQDDIEIFGVEAALIRNNYPQLLEEGHPAKVGACAFLDAEGGCRIYESRPLICRVFGMPLRWLEGPKRHQKDIRSVCALNFENETINDLPVEHCLHMDPLEEKLVLLQMRSGKPSLDKISLRKLFPNH
ncbi:MAG TPA: YkgJ family cysteine cluster protein [Cytophagaceae bacterium]